MSGEDWDAVLDTNLDGFYNILNPLVMPLVRRRKPGRIVTLSSVSGLVGKSRYRSITARPRPASSARPRRWRWN